MAPIATSLPTEAASHAVVQKPVLVNAKFSSQEIMVMEHEYSASVPSSILRSYC